MKPGEGDTATDIDPPPSPPVATQTLFRSFPVTFLMVICLSVRQRRSPRPPCFASLPSDATPLQSQWSLYHHKGLFCATTAPLLSGRWSDRPPILTGPFSHRPPAFNIPAACLFTPFLLPPTPPCGGGQWSMWSAPLLEGAVRTACGAAVWDCWDCFTAFLLG